MAEGRDSGTRISLLGRLRRDPTDAQAWDEFVEQYGRKVYSWCLKWNLQDADAQDVTQNVLLKLAIKLREFEYDPSRSFRAWLRTVAHHACDDYRDSQRRPGSGSGDSRVARLLGSLEARRELLQQLEEQFDLELLEEAMRRVQLRVARQTWEAFRLTALESLPGAAAAKRIPMSVAQVFVAKRRVQAMLREEVARLEQLGPGEGEP